MYYKTDTDAICTMLIESISMSLFGITDGLFEPRKVLEDLWF